MFWIQWHNQQSKIDPVSLPAARGLLHQNQFVHPLTFYDDCCYFRCYYYLGFLVFVFLCNSPH